MKKILLMLGIVGVLAWTGCVSAQSIVYVPMDNRPVNLDYAVDTLRAANIEIIAPPAARLSGRTYHADPDELWRWVFDNVQTADALVLSSDSLIYGGLVPSRTHHFDSATLERRVANFQRLRAMRPDLRIYVFGTIMRTPQYSAGGVEPEYYEVVGHDIFQITALTDKQEISGLSKAETEQLIELKSTMPSAAWSDWDQRRKLNYSVNLDLLNLLRQGELSYLLIGRDDCSPYSQSHRESRWLEKAAAGLGACRYVSFPGADQLGMVMLTRAVNDISFKVPMVRIIYAPGAAGATLPTYEDLPVGETIPLQLNAAGCIPFDSQAADMVLAVNTPVDGVTREANTPANLIRGNAAGIDSFVSDVGQEIHNGKRVAIGDISFANGADNSLMARLSGQDLLGKLAAYSGWNTASNTLGYAIGQGVLSAGINPDAKKRLLAVRYLDDWAYQANVRTSVTADMLYAVGRSPVALNDLTPSLTAETQRRLNVFVKENLHGFPMPQFQATFPWNRMFEIKVAIENK